MAIIKLNNTTVLYLKEVTKFLALVCILREESFERKGKPSFRSRRRSYFGDQQADLIIKGVVLGYIIPIFFIRPSWM